MIESLRIENYKNLCELELHGLGRVNLVTGKNNTGKSSLLEAVYLYANEGKIDILLDILEWRRSFPNDKWGQIDYSAQNVYDRFLDVFSRTFPLGSVPAKEVLISTRKKGRDSEKNLYLDVAYYPINKDNNKRKYNEIIRSFDLDSDLDVEPGIFISFDGRNRLLPATHGNFGRPSLKMKQDDEKYAVNCRYVTSGAVAVCPGLDMKRQPRLASLGCEKENKDTALDRPDKDTSKR